MLEAIRVSIRYRVCRVSKAHMLKLGRIDTWEGIVARIWLCGLDHEGGTQDKDLRES